MDAAEEAARKCITFFQNRHTSWPEYDGALIHYIAIWLRIVGPDVVGGSFEVFVQTVLIVIDEWHKDPSLLDFRQVRKDGKLWVRKRRASCIFRDEKERREWILGPLRFNSAISAYWRWHRPLAPSA
jgi:hypothetical protein